MARNVARFAVPPERVWEVLSDPRCYPRWVVGAKRFRDADPDFPAQGTKFHHVVGIGPIEIQDDSEVLQVLPQRRIVLRAKARPLGTAIVDIRVEPDGDGSVVTLIEEPGDALTRIVFTRILDVLVRGRNAKALDRMRAIAESPSHARRAAAA